MDQLDTELKSVLLRLMLFNNDLAVVTDTIDRWLELPKNAHRRNAASLYFVRIMLGQFIRRNANSPGDR